MKAMDWFILALIAVALVFAVSAILRGKVKCSGDCSRCRSECRKRGNENN